MKRVVDGIHMLPGRVNMYLVEGDDDLTLIDGGMPGSAPTVLAALAELGRSAADLRSLILTHADPDHIGSAAAIVRETGATTYMHPLDAPIAEKGSGFRPGSPAPGPIAHLAYWRLARFDVEVEPCRIDRAVSDGETLPIGGGLHVIHVPGHRAGQIALLSGARRVLFTADACMHVLGLRDPIGFEDQAEGRRSQRKLAHLDFDVACFGHGQPIVGGAADRFRRKWH